MAQDTGATPTGSGYPAKPEPVPVSAAPAAGIPSALLAQALGYAAVIGVSVTAVACIYGLAELLAHWGEIA